MPLDASGTADPSVDGRERLRGAFSIALRRIVPDPAQPRRTFDAVELQNLAASIRERGVKQPIQVWYRAEDNVYQIIAGERRYRAATLAGLPAIPCLVVDPPRGAQAIPRQELLIDQLTENWQRADLNPFELSDALKELRDIHGLNQEQIASLTGKPKSEVSRLLSLQKATQRTQQAIRSDTTGTFSRRHAMAVASLPTAKQSHLVERIQREQLTAIEAERAAVQLLREATGRRTEDARGTERKFAIGSATVVVRFRKSGATDAEVVDVLTKACDLVRRTSETVTDV